MSSDECMTPEEVRAIVQEETADLREQLEKEREERADLEERVDELQQEKEDLRNGLKILREHTHSAIGELQSLELEKGHHLLTENVITGELTNAAGEVEVVDGDDGADYYREPGSADPLERSGESVLATGDLLPIQQLAQMDDDTLASATSKRSDYIAAKLWQQRGQHSPGSVWSRGGPDVREYVDASDVRVFIKSELERDDESLSYDYAKKLAGEALERTRELAKDRGYIQRESHRKDGLAYKERRFVLPADAEIPGESSSTTDETPGTNGVTG